LKGNGHMNKFQEGQRIYRVRWKNGQPYIRHAKAVYATKAKKSLKAELPSGLRETIYGWHKSIKKAIADEIVDCGFHYGKKTMLGHNWETQYPANAMQLILAVSRLARLRRKLIDHGLW